MVQGRLDQVCSLQEPLIHGPLVYTGMQPNLRHILPTQSDTRIGVCAILAVNQMCHRDVRIDG